MTDFAGKLFKARSHLGLTQQETADKLGLSRRYLIELEKGRATASEPLMLGILSVLSQSPVKAKGTAKAKVLITP